jgi:diphthamide synthase (EF-2-diphthine--ammonia ligase)
VSWSGGKDSCAALERARQAFDVEAMITMCDDEAGRSRSHGLRPDVIVRRRARWPGSPPGAEWADYDAASPVRSNRLPHGITHVIFGDILFGRRCQFRRIYFAARPSAVEPLGRVTDVLFENGSRLTRR